MAKKSKNNKRAAIIVASVVAVSVISASVGYILFVKNNVDEWKNKIYPGIKVEGIDLSGMSKAEASNAIKVNVETNVKKKVITAVKDDKSYELNYSELEPKFNIDQTVESAMKEGKDKGLFEKNGIIKSGINKTIAMDFKYDETKLNSFEDKISTELYVKAKDSTLRIRDGQISVSSDATGVQVDKEKFHKILKDSISGDLNKISKVEIPVKITEPKAKKSDLAKIDGVISTFSTIYNPALTDRSENLAVAARYINGKVIMPGEVFSYNDTVGERTAARGFKSGAIFKNNKVEQDIGGGVCQVSTTLYRAIMGAGIKSTERHNHSLKASYSDFGLDATVAWGYLDYKFKNTYNFPIYIEGYTTSNQVVFNIYGNKSGKGTKTYNVVAEMVKTLEPEVKTVNDPTLNEGQVVWDTQPITGYVVKSYRVTYENDIQISKEAIGTDTYAKVDGVKKVGTKKQTTPTPNPVPTPKKAQ